MGRKTFIAQFVYHYLIPSVIFLAFVGKINAGEYSDYLGLTGPNSESGQEIVIDDSNSLDNRALKLEKQGMELFWERRELVEAIRIFEEALKIEPRLVYAPVHIAIYCRTVEGDVKKAVRVLKEAIKHHPGIGWLYIELAETYAAFNKHDKEAEYYKKALKAGVPERADIFYKIGQANYKTEDYDACIEYCNLALGLDPRHDNTRNILTKAYILEGESGKALELVGDSLTFYKLAGALFVYMEDYNRAWDAVEKALSIAPGDEEVIFNKALIMQKEKRFDKAVDLLDRVLESSPANHEVLLHKGICLAELGEIGEALSIFMNLDSLYPMDTRAKCMIGDIYYKQERYKESLVMYKKVMTVEPGNRYAAIMIKIVSPLAQ